MLRCGNAGADEATLPKTVEEFYRGDRFVRVLPAGEFPNTKNVSFTNFCDVAVRVEKRLGRVIAMSAIDNLIKGASGQAVQCLNVACGWSETAGLL
jgi:N-acetyl-gamma-glutamyl-phosphate reductase